MGTSKSSSGPGKNVGLVPPWLDAPPGAPPPPLVIPPPAAPPGNDIGQHPSPPPQHPPLAPPIPTVPLDGRAVPKRFSDARRAIGDYISSGDSGRLRAGLGSYVGKGYRGSRTATARMSQAATSAGRAYDILSGLAEGSITPQDLGFDPATLAGAPMDDVIDALVDAICTNDTTLDDVAGREAVNEALSEVLGENPTVDPLSMPAEHTQEVWLRTAAYHVFEDIMLDLGAGLQRGAAGNAALLNDRRFEIRNFVRESYREQFARIAAQGRSVDRSNATAIARDVTAFVFDVYSGWME